MRKTIRSVFDSSFRPANNCPSERAYRTHSCVIRSIGIDWFRGREPLNQVQKRGLLNTACYRVVLVLLAVVAWVAVGTVGDTLSIGVEGFRETASSEADAPQPPDRELHQGGAGRSNRSDRTSNSARTATTATAIQLP